MIAYKELSMFCYNWPPVSPIDARVNSRFHLVVRITDDMMLVCKAVDAVLVFFTCFVEESF